MDGRDFFSCDWGTTTFRLRRVSGRNLQVLNELRLTEGSKTLYERALADGDATAAGRARVYTALLRKALASWPGAAGPPLPLIISGMASSSVGWQEVPYAEVPFPLNGEKARVIRVEWDQPDCVTATYLVSGVRCAHDMMRGEETEALGLLSDPSLAAWRQESLLILPGTHSKHLVIRDGAIIDFQTYMTGELYSVLLAHSLLKATTTGAHFPHPAPPQIQAAFADGVCSAKERGLGGSLFRTRSRGVLDGLLPEANSAFLSGVLIGAEMRDVTARSDRILLAGSSGLGEFYRTALNIVTNDSDRAVYLPAAQVEKAAALGHSILRDRIAGGTP